jgi:hypothetical protein
LLLHGALIVAFFFLFILGLDYWRIERVRERLIVLRIVHGGQ